ncbi:MAG: rhomboid family intramembrane serine protease [Opitutaceae bacterium]
MASLKAAEIAKHLAQDGFEAPEDLTAVAVYEDFARSGEAGLVILAMGEAYWTLMHGDAYVICVDLKRANSICKELDAYSLLDGTKRVRALSNYSEFSFGWASFVVYAVLLIGVFFLQERYGLVAAGRVDAVAVVEGGQYWRALTALCLHADVVHLVSNLVAGAGFAFFVARFFGAVSGWLLILLSGTAGNLLNAWVYYPEPHFSIGASTAVFGGLGLLTGVGIWVALAEPKGEWTLPRWLLPVFGGFTLLGLIGVGDGLVDVAAHISGFICGIVFGILGAVGQRAFVVLERYKGVGVCAAFGLIALAWFLAYSAA